MSYEVLIRDKSQTLVGGFSTWKDLSFNEKLNDYGQCSFTVSQTDELLGDVSTRIHEVEIRKNGTIVWAGELADKSAQLTVNQDNRRNFTAFTFLESLSHRLTGDYSDTENPVTYVRYEDEELGLILEDLVQTSQGNASTLSPGNSPVTNGDLGFTFGTIDTTETQTIEYTARSIMDAFIEASQINGGIEFDIKFNKEIDILNRKGIDKSAEVVFEYGRNFESVQFRQDFVNPGNQILTIGSGSGSSQAMVLVTDPIAAGSHKIRQIRNSEIDVNNISYLTASGNAMLRKYKQPLLSLKFTQLPLTDPVLGTVKTGDTVRVRLNDGIENINNRFRIYEISTTIDNEGKELITYFVGLI
jgi:hypothetical protein